MPINVNSLRARDAPTPAERKVIDFLSREPSSAFTASEVVRGVYEPSRAPEFPSPWSMANAMLRPFAVTMALEELAIRGRVARVSASGRTWYHIVPGVDAEAERSTVERPTVLPPAVELSRAD